ncbi:MAG: HAD family hydrolase [Leptothrix sp. (in: b-proteobacteria)]
MFAAPFEPRPVRALTLDLDDTLWPIAPVIERAEAVLHDWLLRQAPATAARFPITAMRALRVRVGREHPEWHHDLSALRLHATREALLASGDDPALAEPAFELFLAERQRVEFYADVAAALDRLAARFPLLALSNGNADLVATGLDRWFVGAVNARSCGVAKPDARIFAAACSQLDLAPEQVMHVGDDWQLDIVGARGAGLHTVWVRRESHGAPLVGEGAVMWPRSAPEDGLALDAKRPAAELHWQVADLLALAQALGA